MTHTTENSKEVLHTQGEWRQGYTLMTPDTKRWSQALITANDNQEKRMVFAKYREDDQGRSRNLSLAMKQKCKRI